MNMKHLFLNFACGAVLIMSGSTTVSAQSTLKLDTTFAKKFDPISGPGIPVEGNGYGGWRSSNNSLRYKGNHPKSVYDLNWGSTSSTEAIDSGRVPPILPAIELHVRDAVVTLGGDGNYYMTGSTGDNIWAYAKGIELWRSNDLMEWSYIGLVWDIDKEADEWVREWRRYPNDESTQGVRAVWAPEIHYLPKHDNYYICFSMCPNGIGLLKSSTGNPEGPYVNCWAKKNEMVAKAIDPTLFEDEDGSVYMTFSGGGTIYKLKDDLSGFDGSGKKVELSPADTNPDHHASKCVNRGMGDFGHEGAILFKYKGRYYHGGADSYYGRYSSCIAVSDNIYGPYTMRHEPIPCDGGTNFFVDKNGELWSSYFGNDTKSHFREKFSVIKAQVLDDGRIIPALEQPFVPENKKNAWKTKWDKLWKPLTILTGIAVPQANEVAEEPVAYYDLKGCKHDSLQKGIMVVSSVSKAKQRSSRKLQVK